MRNPFRYFNSSPEVIRLTVMLYIRYPLSLRQVEDLLFERGIDFCHESVRFTSGLSAPPSWESAPGGTADENPKKRTFGRECRLLGVVRA